MSANASAVPAGRAVPQAKSAPATAGTRRVARSRRPAFVPHSSHPVNVVPVKLFTDAAIRVYESCAEPAQAALYLIEVMLPIQSREDLTIVNEVTKIIDGRLSEINQELDDEIARLKTLAENVGTKLPTRYDQPLQEGQEIGRIEVLVRTPSYSRFINLILKMDEALKLIDGLWLGSQVASNERNGAILRWRNRLNRFNRELVNLKNRASAHRDRVERSAAAAAAEAALADADVAVLDTGKKAKAATTPKRKRAAGTRAGPVLDVPVEGAGVQAEPEAAAAA